MYKILGHLLYTSKEHSHGSHSTISVKTRRRGTTSVDELEKAEPEKTDAQQLDTDEPVAKKLKESDDIKADTDSPKQGTAVKPLGKFLLNS